MSNDLMSWNWDCKFPRNLSIRSFIGPVVHMHYSDRWRFVCLVCLARYPDLTFDILTLRLHRYLNIYDDDTSIEPSVRKTFHQYFQPRAVPAYLPIQMRATRTLLQRLSKDPTHFGDHIREYVSFCISSSIESQVIYQTFGRGDFASGLWL